MKTQKLDKRKHYYLTLDTETANSTEKPLVYDIGGAVHDKQGNIYHTFNFIIYDIYAGERELMKTAYYAEKLPLYEKALKDGTITFKRFMTVYYYIHDLIKAYDIKAVIAHNMRFDRKALNNTLRYVTKGEKKWFFPYNTPLWCSWSMARQTIGKQKAYISWANEKESRMTNQKTPQPRLSAEILYQYISGDENFTEDHTALSDVLIEIQITTQCIRQKKKMYRTYWKPRTT